MKKLIVNADDFCLSPIFNETILELLENKTILSTTVMVKRYTPDQDNQVEQLKNISDVGVGLHVEFESGENCREQIERQYEKFVELFNREPSHLDMHRHDFAEVAYPVLMQYATEKNMPYRNNGMKFEGGKTTSAERFSAIANWLDKVFLYIDSLQDRDSGEIVLHPGRYDPDCKTSLNHEREIDTLKAKRIREYADSEGVVCVIFLGL